MAKLLLVDGNSIMNRAFFGLPVMTNSEGHFTNAVYGFTNILLRTIEDEKATHLIVSFDLKAPTFRHNLYAEYKGTRKGMPDELRPQMPLVKELLRTMHICICEKEGYEADDVLGSLATFFSQQKDADGSLNEVTILSGDRDLLQLAKENLKISIPKTKGGITITEHYYWDDVVTAYGVTPIEFIDVKGLMGDTSDNIPGVPGIGEKTAVKIIQTYHTIEEALSHTSELKRAGTLLEANSDMALLSKTLATIITDYDAQLTLDDCTLHDLYNEEAYHLFKRLEFKSHYSKFNNALSSSSTSSVATTSTTPSNVASSTKLPKKDLLDIEVTKPLYYYWLRDADHEYIAYGQDIEQIHFEKFPLEDFAFLDKMRELFQNTALYKCTIDLKSQLHWLNMSLPISNKSFLDLGLAYYIVNPNRDDFQLDDIATEFLGKSLTSRIELLGKGKSVKSLSDIEEQAVMSYLIQSVNVIAESSELIKEQLRSIDGYKLYEEMELPLLYVLKDMEKHGILIDKEGLVAYGQKLGLLISDLEQDIYQLSGEVFNINSPKQLGVILFEKLLLPTAKKTKTGYSTAHDVLERLSSEHPIIDKIMDYRQLTKLKSTYADGLFTYIQEDRRIHSTFNQQIAATGRISSTDPNLQNIPVRMEIGREIRKVFIAQEDYVLIDADYSQIELRLLAHLSQDEMFIKAFNEDLDIHRMTASQVFHTPYEEVTSLQRRNAKAVNFGIVYGISDFGLSQDLKIGVYEAKHYIESYFEKYPKVKSFLDETVAFAKTTGYVETMYHRRRPIPELYASNFIQRSFGERVAMNAPIQGSAADIIKLAMIQIYDRLQIGGFKSRLILQVHDELIIEAHKDEVETVLNILITEMETAAKLLVPLTVDAHVALTWYDAK